MSETNIWDSILQSVSRQESHRESTVIFLGDPESGKHSLYHTLADQFGNKSDFSYQGGRVVDYTSISVPSQDDRRLDEEEFSLLHVWFLNDPRYGSLLNSASKIEMLEHTAFVICVDYSKPWAIMDSLNKWTKVVEDIIKEKMESVTMDKQHALKQSMLDYINSNQNYSKEIENLVVDPTRKSNTLPAEMLTKNLGVPMFICMTKTDCMAEMKRTLNADIRFNFIQKHIRSLAIQYASFVFYVSAHSGVNILEFKDSLLHRLYPAIWKYTCNYQLVDADRIVIPSGWDSSYLIGQLVNSEVVPENSSYNSYIPVPMNVDTSMGEKEDYPVENEQAFLKQFADNQKNATGSSTARSPMGVSPVGANTPKSPTNAADFFKTLQSRNASRNASS
ncbi:hypothetical protein WA158_001631 [Blastocystis sp. Blastoise]